MRKQEKLPRGVWLNKGEYWIRYRDRSGQLHREAVGPLLTQAVAAFQKRRTEIREEKFFPEKVRERSVRFAKVAGEYLERAKARKRSWDKDEDHLENLLPKLKDVPLADVTPGRLEAILNDLSEQRKWAPATFNRHRATLSGVFKQAMGEGKAQSNPARLIARREENNERVRYLSQDEETKLLDALRSEWPEREAEVITAIHSGMRRSEQYRTSQVKDGGLKWEHIDFRARVIRLPRSKPGKAKVIPMNSVLRETLRTIPQKIDSPYVFRGEPDKWFAALVKKAGISDFHWHDLRHNFASQLAMRNVPILTISKLMGHSQVSTTVRYAHLSESHLADAVERLAGPGALVSPVVSPKVSGLPTK